MELIVREMLTTEKGIIEASRAAFSFTTLRVTCINVFKR